jgi:hypothetical protein
MMIAPTHTNTAVALRRLPYKEQIPRQEIVVENQSVFQMMPRAAARFAGDRE